MTKSGHITSSLHVRAKVEDIHQHLHIPLALLVPAMLAGHQEGSAVPHHEHRRERVIGPLLRRNDIGTLRIEGE